MTATALDQLTIADLAPAVHHARQARVGRWEGVLAWAPNPSYPRRFVYHWWIHVDPPQAPRPSTVSLQWAQDRPVTLLTEGQQP